MLPKEKAILFQNASRVVVSSPKTKNNLDGVDVVFGVGGSLDVLVGKVKATPPIWKTLNLEMASSITYRAIIKK